MRGSFNHISWSTRLHMLMVFLCGRTEEEHDRCYEKFEIARKTDNWTLNEEKTVYKVTTINQLRYRISQGVIKPDPERLRPLLELQPSANSKSLKSVLGLFAYYAKWIKDFSKIKPLYAVRTFPLTEELIRTFNSLKEDLAKACVFAIDENIPFVVETDASDFSISATLNEGGRQVAFHSRMSSKCEIHYAPVEKVAHAIVDAIVKWRHYLLGRHFTLVTDQSTICLIVVTTVK